MVGREGTVEADGDARLRLRAYAGTYRLMSDAPGLLLLRRELPEDSGPALADDDDLDEILSLESGELDAGSRVIMAGEILGRMTLFQMIEIISERGFLGELVVLGSDGSTLQLRFDQGALKEARSDHDEDRLGQVLVREGFLTAEQLVELLWEVTPQRRLGQVCLERNLLGQEALFECLRRQTEGIFYRTLLISDGSFVFSTPDPTRAPAALSLHLPVRPLLMHGIQRLDEMELYREAIPSGDVCLTPRPDADDSKLEDDARAVLELSDGSTSLLAIGEATGLGEYELTRVAYHLVRGHLADVGLRTMVDNDAVSDLVERFSTILRDIFVAIEAHGQRASALQMLGAWVQGCGYDSVFGSTVLSNAMIDPATVHAWIAAAREDNPTASFHHVAHELVSFAMFCAGSALPREEELKLSRDVNRRLQAIRVP